MRFAANLSMLFGNVPFIERFDHARRAGFSAVEFWWPSGEDLDEVRRAVEEAGLEVVLFNFDAGDMSAGDRGLLSNPAHVDSFRGNVPVALELARAVGCRQLNALAGLRLPDLPLEEQLALARENAAWAADRAEKQGAAVLIEAVNTIENGPYLLPRMEDAARLVHQVARPNVKLQCDVYHMQRMEGNLAATLADRIGQIAHIQIADSPGRGEPGTGEIHFPFLFRRLEELGYRGWIGLEYRPAGGETLASLEWLPEAGRSGAISSRSLRLPPASR